MCSLMNLNLIYENWSCMVINCPKFMTRYAPKEAGARGVIIQN